MNTEEMQRESVDNQKYSEHQIKHLEFIQSNITRMNQCSFQMKGWMVTIVCALLALYAASFGINACKGLPVFILVAIAPTIVFWFLDSYYLQQERKLRGIYNTLINPEKTAEIKPFSIPLEQFGGWEYSLFCAMLSKTELPLYLLIIVGLTVAGVVLQCF